MPRKKTKLHIKNPFIYVVLMTAIAFSIGLISGAMVLAQNPPLIWHSADEIIPGTFSGDKSSNWVFPGAVSADYVFIDDFDSSASLGGTLILSGVGGERWWVRDYEDTLHIESDLVLSALVMNRQGDVGIGTDNPEANLHVVGDVKMFGTWSSNYNFGNNYQTPSDGFVLAWVEVTGLGSFRDLIGYSGSSSNPGAIRARDSAAIGMGESAFIIIPVRKNHFWRVENPGAGTFNSNIFWVPLGI
jgi:hypothetical protein